MPAIPFIAPAAAAAAAAAPVIGAVLGPIINVLSNVISAAINILSAGIQSVLRFALDTLFGLAKKLGHMMVGIFSFLFGEKGSKESFWDGSWIGRRVKGAFTLDNETFQHIRLGFLNLLKHIGFFNDQVDNSREHLRILLLTTKHAAGVTYTELLRVSSAIAGLSHATQVQGRTAAAIFLGHGRIRGPIFNEALQVLPDLTAALGVELPEAAKAFAQALSKPEQGLALLESMGVVLPAVFAEQFQLMATSSMAGFVRAQRFILERVRDTVRGANEIYSNTLFGFVANIKENLANLPRYLEVFIKPFARVASSVLDFVTLVMERNRDFFNDIAQWLEGFVSDVAGFFTPVINNMRELWPALRPVVVGLGVLLPLISTISHVGHFLLINFGLIAGIVIAITAGASALLRVLSVVLLLVESIRNAFTRIEVAAWLEKLVEGASLFLGVLRDELPKMLFVFSFAIGQLSVRIRQWINAVIGLVGDVKTVMVWLGHAFVESTIMLMHYAQTFLNAVLDATSYLAVYLRILITGLAMFRTSSEAAVEFFRDAKRLILAEWGLLAEAIVERWEPVFEDFFALLSKYYTTSIIPFMESLEESLISLAEYLMRWVKFLVWKAFEYALSGVWEGVKATFYLIAGLLAFVGKSIAWAIMQVVTRLYVGIYDLAELAVEVLRDMRLISREKYHSVLADVADARFWARGMREAIIPDTAPLGRAWDRVVAVFSRPTPPSIRDITLPEFGRLIPDRGMLEDYRPLLTVTTNALAATLGFFRTHAERMEGPGLPIARLLSSGEAFLRRFGVAMPRPVDLGVAPAPRAPAEPARQLAPLPNIIPAKVSFIGLQELYKNIQTQSFQGRMVTLTEQIVNQGNLVVARLDDVNDGIRRINIPGDPGVALFG